jgi:hypothetical protein
MTARLEEIHISETIHDMEDAVFGLRDLSFDECAFYKAAFAEIRRRVSAAPGLERLLGEARDDLGLWHERWTQDYQSGGLVPSGCCEEGCSTCEIIGKIDAALGGRMGVKANG